MDEKFKYKIQYMKTKHKMNNQLSKLNNRLDDMVKNRIVARNY